MLKNFVAFAITNLVLASACFGQAFTTFKVNILRHPSPGYYLLAQNSTDSVALVDNSGENVFAVKAKLPVNLLSTDSTLTYFDVGANGFVRRNSHMAIIDTLKLSGGFDADFHEGHILSNGNYVVLGTETRVMDLSSVVSGGKSQAHVIGAVFQERTFGGTTVFEWKSLDHIPVTDATEAEDLTQTTIDYIHVNAIERDGDGNYLVSCRHLDEIIKVSRNTGNIMWRMGGSKSKNNQFTFIDDTFDGFVGFSHQHDVSRTPSGRILLFDNGNLKPDQPNPYSRVAEYDVNETLKTAKLTWSYHPTQQISSNSLGSAQALPNGNVLVSMGSGSATIICQEVSRDGTVQAEFESRGAMGTYRARKAVFAMSGTERVVTTPGTTAFTHGDSSTHFTAALTRVDAPTSIIAERHSYAPHNMSFGVTPCVPLQMRWVVRASNAGNIDGVMRFNVGALGAKIPSLLQLFYREREGLDPFLQVQTTYDAASTSLVTNSFEPGEYMLAYPMCYDPATELPLNNAVNVSPDVFFRWTAGVQTGGYDVEIFEGAGTSGTPVKTFHTSRLDTTVALTAGGTRYTWRVRAVRPAPNPNGNWSAPFTFRTGLSAPVALSPKSLPDSVAVQQKSTFKWTKVKNAERYHLKIVPLGTSIPVVDTLVLDTACVVTSPLPWNKEMLWFVRAEIDTNGGAWSGSLVIVTPPGPPRLMSPAAEEQNVSPESLECSWERSEGTSRYHIRVYKGTPNSSPWFEDTVTTITATLPDMPSVTQFHWQVRGLGRFGAGPWSDLAWFMTRGQSILGRSSLLAPADEALNVDTLQSMLRWSPVPEATSYRVQLTTKSTFSQPDFEWNELHTTSKECPPLLAGKVYRWRVMATNDIASGPWSDTSNFLTMPGPDDALEPLTPITGCLDVPVKGNVTFLTGTRFNEYHVEYSTAPLFIAIEQIATVTSGVAPYSLLPEQEYFWRVVGLKNGTALDTGATSSFKTGKDEVISTVTEQVQSTVHFNLFGTLLIVQGATQGADLMITDVSGRQMYRMRVADQLELQVELSHLPKGVYLASISEFGHQVETHLFVISSVY